MHKYITAKYSCLIKIEAATFNIQHSSHRKQQSIALLIQKLR